MARFELLNDKMQSQQANSGQGSRFTVLDNQETQQPEESLGDWGKRQLARAPVSLAKIATIPGDLGQMWVNYMHGDKPGEPDKFFLPQSKDIDEVASSVAKDLDLPKDYFKTQGKLDEFMDMMTVDLPAIVMTGGSPLWKRALASAVSSGAMMGAKEAGAGPIGQIAAGLTGRVGTNFFSKGGGLKSIRNAAEIKRKEVYHTAEEEAKKIFVDAPEIESTIGNLADEARKDYKFIGKNDTVSDLNQFANSFKNGKISLLELWDHKKKINNRLGELYKKGENVQQIKYMKRALEPVLPFMENMATKYPKFGMPYKIGENLTVGLHAKGAIQKMIRQSSEIEDLIKSNPLTRLLFLGGSGLSLGHFGFGKTAFGIGSALAANRIVKPVAQYAGMFTKSSEIRKLIHEAGKRAMMEDKEGLISVLLKLNNIHQDLGFDQNQA